MTDATAGRAIAVTGASMGIGEAIAKVFVDHGFSAALLARDPTTLEQARQRIGKPDRTVALTCDVRKADDIKGAVAAVLKHYGRIDVWVNNAGHGLVDAIASVDVEQFRSMFETNVFGALVAMQQVIPVMQRQGSGTIINVSSVAGHIPVPFHAAYSATKFALNAIGKGASVELRRDGIRVMTVCPGYVRTNFGENAVVGSVNKRVRPDSVRGITADRVARATWRGYLRGGREVIVPWTMHVPVKVYQLLPSLVERVMGRMAG